MKKLRKTINGKTYELETTYISSDDAKRMAKSFRNKGYLAQVKPYKDRFGVWVSLKKRWLY